MPNKFRIALDWTLAAACMVLIFFGSAQEPTPSTDFMEEAGFDKVAHAFEYAVLAFFFLRALDSSGARRTGAAIIAVTAVFCALYAASDEMHQSFVPGRVPDWLDFLSDIGGTAVMAGLWALFAEKHRRLFIIREINENTADKR